jgi:hypothetical protein
MNQCEFPAPPKRDQITNQPTNQGWPRVRLCICRGMQSCVVSFGPSRGRGIHQINLSQGAGGRFVDLPAKGPILRNRVSIKQRIQYPPCQFIANRIKYLKRGVTKP